MSYIYAEQFLINVGIFLVLRILNSGRVHQRAQRALDLHNWNRSLLDEIYVCNPPVLFLILQEIRYPSKGILDPGVMHSNIFLLIQLLFGTNNEVNITPMEAKTRCMRAVNANIIVRINP